MRKKIGFLLVFCLVFLVQFTSASGADKETQYLLDTENGILVVGQETLKIGDSVNKLCKVMGTPDVFEVIETAQETLIFCYDGFFSK